MIPALQHRLGELRRRIELIRIQGMCFSVETEACFRLADLELKQIVARLDIYNHESDENQVWIYKVLLPEVLAEKEYYRLINYANSFCPDHLARQERRRFWTEQAKRLNKFRSKYRYFCDYELSGSTTLDSHHYSFQANESYVELRGWWLARLRYDAFVHAQLQCI